MKKNEAGASHHELIFLGTGAGSGMPSFFCTCAACEEARVLPAARRGASGVVIEGTQRVLIDTPPDLRLQLVREGLASIESVLFTHSHYDHLGGLGELEYMIQLSTHTELPVYASEQALGQIRSQFDFMTYCLSMTELNAFEEYHFDGLTYTPLPVRHSEGTFGYLIDSGASRTFYACDTGTLPDATSERVQGVDNLILDATFWSNNRSPQMHNTVQETIEEGLSLDAGQIYLTHLGMHFEESITLTALEAYLAQYEGRVRVALDGMRITL